MQCLWMTERLGNSIDRTIGQFALSEYLYALRTSQLSEIRLKST